MNVCTVTKAKHAMREVEVQPDGSTKRLGSICPTDYLGCSGVDVFCPRSVDQTNSLEELAHFGSVGSQDTGPWFALTNGHNETVQLTLSRPFSTEKEPLTVDGTTWGASLVMRCWQMPTSNPGNGIVE